MDEMPKLVRVYRVWTATSIAFERDGHCKKINPRRYIAEVELASAVQLECEDARQRGARLAARSNSSCLRASIDSGSIRKASRASAIPSSIFP